MAENGERRRGSGTSTRQRTREPRVRGAQDAARRAGDALRELVDHHLEGVSGVRKGEDGGWIVDVDVLEVARIPDTTSLLATYEVELDADGELSQYRRTARYRRGGADQ